MPILNFFTHKDDYPYGTDDRNVVFLIGHLGFWFFNFLNVSYLILFEWFAFGRLRKNRLSQLSLLASFTQMISCCSSIYRYNTNDEYGFWGHFSTIVGLIAYTVFNIAFIYLCFHRNDPKFIGIGGAFCAVVGIACFVLGYIKWEEAPFVYFRIFIGVSTVWHIVAMNIGLNAHRNGVIQIDASIISSDNMNNTFVVCILLDVVALIIALTGLPVFTYALTGMTFTSMTILMVFVGRMDFMQQDSSPSVEGAAGETTNLLPKSTSNH